MCTGVRRHAVALLLLVALLAVGPVVLSHDHPTTEEIAKAKMDGTYEKRLQRALMTNPHLMDTSLQQRARFKLQYEALKAQGLGPAEVSRRLFGPGPDMAFPFAADPELSSQGTVRTLTVLIDFKDHRAATVLPGITAATVAPNIYAAGTPAAAAFAPFESVNAYYARASEGRVNVQGNVLGWYGFAKDRAEYEPATAANPNDQAVLDNQALFNLVTEALDSFATTHNFAQYDNDNDGDIDLVTILYAGPDTGWGSFWWAYRWQFFIADAATKTYNGKRLRQFVFQFVDRRGPANDDFNPRTLIHEMGHAFGLADYYDYKPGVGNDGGVGRLDMMDANRGNHCAFSRWLLDWIQPEVVGAGAPATRQLVASGSVLPGNKAVAIFPNLASTTAPGQELFLLENRFRVGNDAGISGTFGDGLLIWHIDARPDSFNSNFLQNNSDTTIKLIRLVRADNGGDFASGQSASSATYFTSGREFTPTSTPSSNSHAGSRTGVSVTNISAAGETMTATVGILPPPGPSPAAPAGDDRGAARINRDVQRMVAGADQPAGVDTERLLRLAADFRTATPDMMKTFWANGLETYRRQGGGPEALVPLQLILAKWAAKDGEAACRATLALPEGDLKRTGFPLVMEAWAASNPYAAKQWYFAPAQEELRKSPTLAAGRNFASRVVRWSALNGVDEGVKATANFRRTAEVWGALAALEDVRGKTVPRKALNEKLKSAGVDEGTFRTYQQFRDTILHLDDNVKDPKTRDELRDLMLNRSGRP